MPMSDFSRRGLVVGAASAAGLIVAGCNRLAGSATAQKITGSAEGLTMGAQRLLLRGQPLARTFDPRFMSPVFKVNGSSTPSDPAYLDMAKRGFADWRLKVDGLVHRPMSFSLSDLQGMPARSQITRHDCVEGWSAIGKWTGAELGLVLSTVGLAPQARYIVFHCADKLDDDLYYESIDLFDAFHPQTLLAYAMNDKPLEIGHGAPVRLRVERQLGYKHAKFLMRIEVTDSLAKIGQGKGGYWEDRGYQWYAGI